MTAPGTLLEAIEIAPDVPGSRAWKVRFASTDMFGRRTESTGVVAAPAGDGRARPVVVWCHADVEIAALLAAQHAGVGVAAAHVDALEDLAAFAYAQHRVAHGRDPDTALGIQADAVGEDVAGELREYAVILQPPAFADRPGVQPGGKRLGDDQRAPVRADHAAVRADEAIAGLLHASVRLHLRDRGGARRFALVEIETDVADIGAALRVHHHVVAVARVQCAQFGPRRECAVAPPVEPALVHRDHEHVAVRQPADSRGAAGNLEGLEDVSGGCEAPHETLVLVREPQGSGVPARALRKREAACEGAWRGAHAFSSLHTRGGSRRAVRCRR